MIANDLTDEIEASNHLIDQLRDRQTVINKYLDEVFDGIRGGFEEVFAAVITHETARVARLTTKANELVGNAYAPPVANTKRLPPSPV